jgi:hypothetical protein
MEPITVATIFISFVFGLTLGFATMVTGDPRIKMAADATGLIALLLILYAAIPTTAWETPIYEATQNIVDFTTVVGYAVPSYVIADAIGTVGFSLVAGFEK